MVAAWLAVSTVGCSLGARDASARDAGAARPTTTTTTATGADPGAPATAAVAPEGDDPEADTAEPTDAGAPIDAQAADITDAAAVPAAPPSWAEEIARTTPFGCTVRAVERDVLLRGPERNAAFRAWAQRARRWALVPAAVGSTLARPGVVYLVTSAGLCRATVGSPVLGGVGDRPVLGSRIAGCAGSAAPFALVCEPGTQLPRGPRWARLGNMRVRRLAATGPAGDVLADRSFRAFGVLLPQTSRRAFRQARDEGTSLRRVSIRSFDLPGDSLRVVDLGWAFFAEGDDPSSACPRADLLASALYLRVRDAPTGDAGAADAWRRGGAFRGAMGVIHDGSRVLAVASSQTSSGGSCWGAESCREIVLHPRSESLRLERGARAPYGFSSGEIVDRSPLSLAGARDCAE